MSGNAVTVHDASNPALDSAAVVVTNVVDCSIVHLKRNFILAKVNNAKMVLSSGELQQLMNAGYDVEVVTPV